MFLQDHHLHPPDLQSHVHYQAVLWRANTVRPGIKLRNINIHNHHNHREMGALTRGFSTATAGCTQPSTYRHHSRYHSFQPFMFIVYVYCVLCTLIRVTATRGSMMAIPCTTHTTRLDKSHDHCP